MDRSHWILIIAWFLFGIVHSLTATRKFKSAINRLNKGLYKHYRIFYIAIASISFSLILAYQLSLSSYTLFNSNGQLYIISFITGLAGISIMAASIYKYFITGVAMKGNTEKQKLVITGLNKFVRHPLYAGTLITIWSIFFLQPLLSTLVSSTIITVYTITGIYFEERKLLDLFGNDYVAYKKKVSMIVPFK